MNRIDNFRGEYRFLSNFFAANVVLDGWTFRSVEHAYQAAKTIDWNERSHIYYAQTAGDAKRLGQKVTLREGWEGLKIQVMKYLVWQKFSTNPNLRDKLLATGSVLLVEGNTWKDTFWGVCGDRGQNHLGLILMEVRRHLRDQHDASQTNVPGDQGRHQAQQTHR